MKKILITAANEPKAYMLAHLLKENNIVFGDSEYQEFSIPKDDSNSYAHELLSICLDHHIDLVFPLKRKEILALTEAKVLFSEYGIDLMVPSLEQVNQLNDLFIEGYSSLSSIKRVANFADFSKTLLSMGYPNTNLAIGLDNDDQHLLIIDDKNKLQVNIWNNLSRVSFTQLAKALNINDFKEIKVYASEDEIAKLDVLFYNNELFSIQHISSELTALIQQQFVKSKLTGFFEITFSGNQLLRIKANSL